uniref:Chemokine interleukin-8-like domain-containing protein n=1 Tax=Oncorhynchus tshawytscha TaxID=74940 RepID=A0AAZ3Q1Y6_ONCTS
TNYSCYSQFTVVNHYVSMSYCGGPSLQRCMCIEKEAGRIGRFISKIQLNAPSSSCNVVEIIATLKTSGQEVCLDGNALWVRKILEKLKVQPDSP